MLDFMTLKPGTQVHNVAAELTVLNLVAGSIVWERLGSLCISFYMGDWASISA